MNFWERVDLLLELNNIARKVIALELNFDVSNIAKGKRIGGTPRADLALQIADYLGVSLESLVFGFESEPDDMPKYRNYAETISVLDSLPEAHRLSIIHFINETGEYYRKTVAASQPAGDKTSEQDAPKASER